MTRLDSSFLQNYENNLKYNDLWENYFTLIHPTFFCLFVKWHEYQFVMD